MAELPGRELGASIAVPASERLLREAGEPAPTWFLTVQGPALVAVDGNPACERAFGGPVQGRALTSLFTAGEVALLVDRVREAMRSGRSESLDRLAVSTAGEEARRWAFFLCPQTLGPEASREVVIAGVDVTAASGAREWAAAVDSFLAQVSHDLRAPITAILGWVRLLGDSALSPEKRAHGLAVIERNARRQVQLIERLREPPAPPPSIGGPVRRTTPGTSGVHA